jgi:hypothetical protein
MNTQLHEELVRTRHDEITRIRAGYLPVRKQAKRERTDRGGIIRRWRHASPAHSS